jgi:hypothetical protein
MRLPDSVLTQNSSAASRGTGHPPIFDAPRTFPESKVGHATIRLTEAAGDNTQSPRREARPLQRWRCPWWRGRRHGRVYGITLPKSVFGRPINPMLFGRRKAVWNNGCFMNSNFMENPTRVGRLRTAPLHSFVILQDAYCVTRYNPQLDRARAKRRPAGPKIAPLASVVRLASSCRFSPSNTSATDVAPIRGSKMVRR